MRYLGMVGCTYRRGGQESIERLTFSSECMADSMRDLHQSCGFRESIYLATCNRVEVLLVGDDSTSAADDRRRIYHFFHPESEENSSQMDIQKPMRLLHAYGGEGAAEHFFCVASALDSMNLGEKQILGQVKRVYRRGSDQNCQASAK